MRNKINLKDVTFLLLIRLDSIPRLENILSVTQFIYRYFDTTIQIMESDRENNKILKRLISKKIDYLFYKDYDTVLYRTKQLNYMLRTVVTPFVAIWDVDVIASPLQIERAVMALRNNECDFIYPYQKLLLDTTPILREIFVKKLDINIFERNRTKMNNMYGPDPVGGAFFCNMESYKKSGFENEEFYGWGLEDGERYTRWKRLGFKIKRIQGPLYHLSHPRGLNSTDVLQTEERNMKRAQELLTTHYLTSKDIPIKYETEITSKNI